MGPPVLINGTRYKSTGASNRRLFAAGGPSPTSITSSFVVCEKGQFPLFNDHLALEDEVRRSQAYAHALHVDVKRKISCHSVDVGDTHSLILDCPKVTVTATVRIAIEYEGLITAPGSSGVNLAKVELINAVDKIHDFVAIGAVPGAKLKDITTAATGQRILLPSPTVEDVVAGAPIDKVGDIVANDRVV